MRRTALCLCLLACPLALAQDEAPVTPEKPEIVRVAIALTSEIDGEPEKLNTFQYFIWERLNHFGLRVDSLNPINHAQLEQVIAKRAGKWAEMDPEDAIPIQPAITIEGRASCEYNNSEFFGQGQAHNFRGMVEATIKDSAGETLSTVKLNHSWGRLPTNYTKRRTLQEYNSMLFGAVLIHILNQEEVIAGVPSSKRGALQAFLAQKAQMILRPLEANMSDCEVAEFVRSFTEQEGGDQEGK